MPNYDPVEQTYNNVLTVNRMPAGPLAGRIRRQKIVVTGNNNDTHIRRRSDCDSDCVLTVMNLGRNTPMTADCLPNFVCDLMDRGYSIDTHLSQMYAQVAVTQPDRTFCCVATYVK